MELNDNYWKPKSITVEKIRLPALVRDFDSNNEYEAFWQREKAAVIASGGALFRHTSKPDLEEVRLPNVPVIAHRYSSPPIAEIWYVSKCRFEELLGACRYFDFPSKAYSADPDAVFRDLKYFLCGLHQKKHLAITQIEDSHIMLELESCGDSFDEQEMFEVIQFNKEKFDVQESKNEEIDKVRNWMKHQFFTIGAI